MITIEEIRDLGQSLKEILGLRGSPVGIKVTLVGAKREGDTEIGDQYTLFDQRFCHALMQARNGANVFISAENITCPAAARAFGFRPLPETLRTGKGLVGFGITSKESVGKKMFEGMKIFQPGEVSHIILFPLEEAKVKPHVVVVEDEVEKLMWIVLASVHCQGRGRATASTAVLQATCVDSTIIPFQENRLNLSFGCYGCRDATDMSAGEAILGFPADELPGIVEHLKYLEKKAIPHSRGKHAYSAFTKEKAEGSKMSC